VGISLLSMNALELEDFIINSIESNPFLAEDEYRYFEDKPLEHSSEHSSEQSSCRSDDHYSNRSNDHHNDHIDNHYSNRIDDHHSYRSDDHYSNRSNDHHSDHNQRVNIEVLLDRMRPMNSGTRGGSYGEVRAEYPFERSLTNRESLQDQLEACLSLELNDPRELAIGTLMIGHIDANGYLQADIEEIALQTGESKAYIQEVLRKIQTALPAGIGARSLKECLLLQLEAQAMLSPLVRKVIEEHLEDIARGKLKQIAKAQGATVGEIQGIADCIRELNPRPGLQLAHDWEPPIWPEVQVLLGPQGSELIVQMLEPFYPRVKLDESYLSLLNQKNIDTRTQNYLNECYREAQGIMRGIAQRQETINKVAKIIVKLQQDFFLFGPEHLKPLTMAFVAQLAGVHESTVSRVVNGTHMRTPHGVIEMRAFCCSGLSRESDDELSSDSVKCLLRKLIEAENPQEPLSDEELCQSLHSKGIEISRRTVNKYRTSLRIPTCAQRKRFLD